MFGNNKATEGFAMLAFQLIGLALLVLFFSPLVTMTPSMARR